jgi:hypothetical protein
MLGDIFILVMGFARVQSVVQEGRCKVEVFNY